MPVPGFPIKKKGPVRPRASVCLWCCIALASGMASYTEAAFVNDVEHFDGTQKDLTNWQGWSDGGSSSQNGRLFVSALSGKAEYRARFATVGIGGFVQVTSKLTAIGSGPRGGDYYLSLNTAPYDTGWAHFSDRSVSLEPRSYGDDFPNGVSYYGDGHGTGDDGALYNLVPVTVLPLNQDFIVRIDYLTANSVEFSTFDTAMNPISSRTVTLSDLPDRFHITIGAYLANASFDDLTIGGNASIPEPACAGGVMAGFALLRRRRPHG